jgi:hypothetical protein
VFSLLGVYTLNPDSINLGEGQVVPLADHRFPAGDPYMTATPRAPERTAGPRPWRSWWIASFISFALATVFVLQSLGFRPRGNLAREEDGNAIFLALGVGFLITWSFTVLGSIAGWVGVRRSGMALASLACSVLAWVIGLLLAAEEFAHWRVFPQSPVRAGAGALPDPTPFLLTGAVWFIGLIGGCVALVWLRGRHARLEKLAAWIAIVLGMLPVFAAAVFLSLWGLGF